MKKRLVFAVLCLDRDLEIDVDVTDFEEASKILHKRYIFWNRDGSDTLGDACCEEYMLEGLTEAGIEYKEIEYIHILTFEIDGVQDDVQAFADEETMIEVFCEHTDVSWDNYLNNKYEYIEGKCFLRYFKAELRRMETNENTANKS